MIADQEKIGKFIKQLREEAHLTQDQLADKLYIRRQSVSKWERGENRPDFDTLVLLADIFKVDISEMIAGERRKNKDYISILKKLYNSETKLHKTIIKLIIIIVVILIALGVYFFANNYNKIKVYTISGTGENTTIRNGILVGARDKLYFSLGDLENKTNITNLRLYYKDKDNNDVQIYTCDNCKSVYLFDYNQYDIYIDYKNIKNVANNLYIDVTYDNGIETIKLESKEDFKSNFKNIFKYKVESINNDKVDENSLIEEYEKLIAYIEENFENKDDGFMCNYEEKNETINVSFANYNLSVIVKNADQEEKIRILQDKLFYVENNQELINYNLKERQCTSGQCENFINNIYNILKKLCDFKEKCS